MTNSKAEITKALLAMIAEIRPKAPALSWQAEKILGAVLDKDMGLDSLDVINLYFKIEKTFSFKISAEDISSHGLSSIGALTDYISEKTTP
ncbi:MAG: acyl carrier protein [Alphaproteobacteria bacterium]|nr:acyl carrier protein [Alphaproteobacteria bacterium]